MPMHYFQVTLLLWETTTNKLIFHHALWFGTIKVVGL